FVNEHILRFLGMREPHDYYHGPIYYYAHRLFLYFIPWCFLAGVFLFRVPRGHLRSPDFPKFLWLWFGVTFAFFSFSQAKANYYLVTVMPPLAILFARHLDQVWEAAQGYVKTMIGVLVLLVPLVAFGGLLYRDQ